MSSATQRQARAAPPASTPPACPGAVLRVQSSGCRVQGSGFRVQSSGGRFRAKRGQLNRVKGLLPESQGHNLALTGLYVPYSLDSGRVARNPEASESCATSFDTASLSWYILEGLESAVEPTRHIYDSQGQILALAFRQKSLNPFKLLRLRSEAV